MRVVVDTNVIVSGLLSPRGAPSEVLNLLIGGRIVLLYDDRIIEEYAEVLQRPIFKFDRAMVEQLLFFFRMEGEWVDSMPLNVKLRDPADLPFLECAVSGDADALITGNLRHFNKAASDMSNIVSPHQFIQSLPEK